MVYCYEGKLCVMSYLFKNVYSLHFLDGVTPIGLVERLPSNKDWYYHLLDEVAVQLTVHSRYPIFKQA